MGYNIGIYGGYDFGVFRLEGEVDWMHANLDQLSIDSDFIDAINSLASPDLIDTGVDVDQASSALAFMLNGLVDFGDDDGFSFQAGLGAGWAKSKLINDKDSAFAWQAILGVNYAVSPNIDIGMRYKYFTTGSLNFHDNTNSFIFRGACHFLTPEPPIPAIQNVLVDVGTDLSTSSRRIACSWPDLQLRRAAASAATTASAASAASGDAGVPDGSVIPGDRRLPTAAATAAATASAEPERG
jgi:hypothetical protein